MEGQLHECSKLHLDDGVLLLLLPLFVYLGFDPLIEDSDSDIWVRSPEERGCSEMPSADGAYTQGTHRLSRSSHVGHGEGYDG